MELRTGAPIALEAVEPATDIVRRFISAAMSLGALSPETQQTIAIADGYVYEVRPSAVCVDRPFTRSVSRSQLVTKAP